MTMTMAGTKLTGRRVLIVGGSKGIGLATGRLLDAQGAHVALAARSISRLEEAVRSCTNDALAFPCDVRNPEDCRSVVDRAVAALGGLDALIYSTGLLKYTELIDAAAHDWTEILETNLVGAALITRHAVPHLIAAQGHAIYLSSISASSVPPWRGIGPYITSKLALERLAQCWEVENPEIAFTTLVVGQTATEFGTDDPDGAMRFAPEWAEKGYVTERMLEPEVHAEAIMNVLVSPARLRSVVVVPR
jgi:NAD(P)-dependent dehydrogenase (short-subunit alcohol dehydrogenase family)